MKFTVELEDFYLEEQDLQSGLIDAVKRDVIHQIRESIKTEVENKITNQVKLHIKASLDEQIQEYIKGFIKVGKVKSNYSNDPEVTIEDYIKEMFVKASGWNSPKELIEKIGKQIGVELKARYDMGFANQIVTRMAENKFLRDDVAKILLTDDSPTP